MDGGSEAEKKKPPEGETKSKRKMKTASQLEILEKTYAVHSYPSEELRAELSTQLGLSDRQLQMWFCHRRLKDRKAPPVKRQPKDSPSAVPLPGGDKELAGTDSSPFARAGMAVQRIGGDVAAMKRYYEMPPPQQSIAELRAIAFVEAQLGEPLREDGPIIGMEFDPLPPDAFGAPIGKFSHAEFSFDSLACFGSLSFLGDNIGNGTMLLYQGGPATGGQQNYPGLPFETKQYDRPDVKPVKDMFTVHPQGATRTLHEYQFLPEQPTVRTDTYERAAPSYHYGSPVDSRQNHLFPSASEEYENVPRKNSFVNTALDAHFGAHAITALENQFVSSDRRVTLDEDASRMEKKRKSEEARIAREVEVHEKRIRKELEKQDILRRKREEQIRKEMERHDRERRKEEERLLREKQREEERYLREQRRELERREKFLQKESIRAEKMRQKEELRREKEAARLRAANERAIARKIAKESMELIEDERLELMELAAVKQRTAYNTVS
ncbi:hypothetical protein Patl1_02335 [Pistacia atlantica]|uniref:Uncharacterized protein n=1 Tax=Pistacia atlantica TaxID=434234 RepID=A0ACC1C7M1_9ROSI|nr:hypothetical protein Patl1_02335 [Pistacia atlantica]